MGEDEKEGRRDCRAASAGEFTWTQTHQCAAWCCPVESDGGSCTCLGPAACSQRGSYHWPSSWFHPERLPTLRKEPSEGDKDSSGLAKPEPQCQARKFLVNPPTQETDKLNCILSWATFSS